MKTSGKCVCSLLATLCSVCLNLNGLEVLQYQNAVVSKKKAED